MALECELKDDINQNTGEMSVFFFFRFSGSLQVQIGALLQECKREANTMSERNITLKGLLPVCQSGLFMQACESGNITFYALP